MGIIHCNATERLIKNICVLKQHFTGQSPFCIIPLSCNYKNPTSLHYIFFVFCFCLFFVEYILLPPPNHNTTSFYKPFRDQKQRFNCAWPHFLLFITFSILFSSCLSSMFAALEPWSSSQCPYLLSVLLSTSPILVNSASPPVPALRCYRKPLSLCTTVTKDRWVIASYVPGALLPQKGT